MRVWQSNQIKSNQMRQQFANAKHPKLYHLSSTITSIKTGKITPVEFCLECDCHKFIEEVI